MDDVAPPHGAPLQRLPADVEAAIQSFDKENAAAWPPVFYPGEQLHAELQQLYSDARHAYMAAISAPSDALDSKKKADAGKAKKGKDVPDTPPSPPKYPELWKGSLDLLREVIADAAATCAAMAASHAAKPTTPPTGNAAAQAAAAAAAAEAATAAAEAAQMAAALPKRLEGLLGRQELHVPTNDRVMLRHAVRAALSRAVDAVAAKLGAVRADYDARLAESKAAAEAAASAGVSTAGAVQMVGPQWLQDKLRAGKE